MTDSMYFKRVLGREENVVYSIIFVPPFHNEKYLPIKGLNYLSNQFDCQQCLLQVLN